MATGACDDEADEVSRLIVLVARAHRARAAGLLATVGLHPGQEFLILQLDGRDGQTQAELAEALAVEPPTITKMVSRLEVAGLVARSPDEQDRRTNRIHLSPAGRRLVPRLRRLWASLEADTVAGLSDRDLAALRRTLAKVATNLGS